MAQNDKKTILIIGVICFVLFGAGIFGIYYCFGLIEEEKVAITGIKKDINTATGKIKQIRKLEDDVIILRENVEEYAKVLPDDRQVSEYARTLTQYCRNAGVALTDLAPENKKGTKGKGFASISYKLKFKGTFWQILRLINSLENHQRFMEVKSMNLKAGIDSGVGVTVVHQAIMVVETYTYSDKGNESEKVLPIKGYDKKKTFLEPDIQKKRVAFDRQPYRFKGQAGRRDIFVDPRVHRAGPGDPNEWTREQQKEYVELAISALTELEKIKEFFTKEGNIIKRNQLQAKYSEEYETLGMSLEQYKGKVKYPQYASKLAKFVIKPYKGLEKVLGESNSGRRLPELMAVADLKLTFKYMEELLVAGNLEDAQRVFKGCESELTKITQAGQADAQRMHWVKLIQKLNFRAKVAKEFRSIKLTITGKIIVDEADHLSLVIINNESYFEGDPFRHQDNLFIKSVANDHVVFIYKGVILKKYQ